MRKIINTSRALLLTVFLSFTCAAQGDSLLAIHPLNSEHMAQWRLPERLHEVSGLALTEDQRLIAVADERAVVFELDVDEQRLKKVFAMGDPVVRGDFEGIAVFGEMIYLITSDGDIYASPEGDDGESVDFTMTRTDLGERCEIEGLAANTVQRYLLIVCKQPRNGMQRLPIFAWSIDEQAVLDGRTLDLPVEQISRAIRERRVNPSGIAIDPASGNLLLIAARQRAIIELSADGQLISALPLPLRRRHKQPEGIEIMSDGRLLIADEGGNNKARLAVYEPALRREAAGQ